MSLGICFSILFGAYIIRQPLVKIQKSIKKLEENCLELNLFFNRNRK
jgi:hypothetical protein